MFTPPAIAAKERAFFGRGGWGLYEGVLGVFQAKLLPASNHLKVAANIPWSICGTLSMGWEGLADHVTTVIGCTVLI